MQSKPNSLRFGVAEDGSRLSSRASEASAPQSPSTSGATTFAGETSIFWPAEPTNLRELEEKYEVIASFPGRLPTTTLKIVNAVPKSGGEPQDISEGQVHKLFLVACSN